MKMTANIITTLLVITLVLNSIQAQVKFTETAGGQEGQSFMIPADRSDVLKSRGITGIAIQHSRRVERIVVEYNDGQNQKQVESIGNNAGQWSFITLEKGEFITYVSGKAGTLIDQVTFHTSLRRTFGPYGGDGGQYFELEIPSDAKVIGFKGKSGPCITQLGLIYKVQQNEDSVLKYRNRGTRVDEATIVEKDNLFSKIVRDHRTNQSKTKRTVRDHRTKPTGSTKVRTSETQSTKNVCLVRDQRASNNKDSSKDMDEVAYAEKENEEVKKPKSFKQKLFEILTRKGKVKDVDKEDEPPIEEETSETKE